AVDYSAVALRRRSVIEVSKHAAVLGSEYWHGITFGIIESWRGVGASDDDGRKLAAAGLNGLIGIRYDSESTESWSSRTREVLEALLNRILTEGSRHIEIFHGGLWALSELLDGIRESSSPTTVLTARHQ